ncbi:unnamed protein product, partial [Rotaria magnacalcarata]
SVTTNTRQIKLNEKPKRVSTTLLSDWVCTNILPSNIIDDCGLTELFDYCIQIGCTAQWIDEDWNLCTFELFCLLYRNPNKTAANLIKVIEEGLALYDLEPFMVDIIWICDRGSNFVKALSKFTVVHCIAHRLNNVLQHTFYQAEINKTKKSVFADHYIECADDEDNYISSTDTEDDYSSGDDENLIEKGKKGINNFYRASIRNNNNVPVAQIPSDAKRVLITIV